MSKAYLTIEVDMEQLLELVKAHKEPRFEKEWCPDRGKDVYEVFFEMPSRIGIHRIEDYPAELEDEIAEELIAQHKEPEE